MKMKTKNQETQTATNIQQLIILYTL